MMAKKQEAHGFRPELARWRQLPSPAWLARLLAGEAVLAAPGGRWRLLEVGCDAQADYAAGHIPGAGYLDTNCLERLPLWNKVCDRSLLKLLLTHGIRHDTTVILYGRGALAAARAAHLMLYAGVADVRLLDGGFEGWLRAGGALQCGAPQATAPAADFGLPCPARPDYLVDTAQVRQLLQQPDAALVSIRTWQEHIGATSGYSYIDACGDIPGARWGRAGNDGDVHDMSAYQQADGTMRPPSEIRAMWQAAGLRPGQRTAFYCGTGWRASLAFFYAWLMDWEHISVYDGGWCEWSRTA